MSKQFPVRNMLIGEVAAISWINAQLPYLDLDALVSTKNIIHQGVDEYIACLDGRYETANYEFVLNKNAYHDGVRYVRRLKSGFEKKKKELPRTIGDLEEGERAFVSSNILKYKDLKLGYSVQSDVFQNSLDYGEAPYILIEFRFDDVYHFPDNKELDGMRYEYSEGKYIRKIT